MAFGVLATPALSNPREVVNGYRSVSNMFGYVTAAVANADCTANTTITNGADCTAAAQARTLGQ